MGRQGHFIDLLILMANSQRRTTNHFCWKCYSVAHFTQSTEQYSMELIRIDLKNSIVVGSVNGNTRTDGSRHVLVQCMRVLMVRERVRVQVLSSQVRVHYFQVQVQVL